MVFVGFSTPRRWNPLSALIRAMTRSRTSHAWLLVEDPAFELRLVLEAHSSGFRLVSFTRFVKDNVVVALVEPAHPIDAGLPAAGQWLGESFDVLGLFGIFLSLVARWLRQRPWKNPFPSAQALFCSEAVVRTLQAAGYPGAAALPPEETTPGELLAFFEADPACVIRGREDLNLWRHLRERLPASAAPPSAAAAPPRARRDRAAAADGNGHFAAGTDTARGARTDPRSVS